MDTWGFAKGHGTRNDFVLLKDRTGSAPLEPEQVRFLCDRHGGIGADGVIRAIKAAHVPGWDGDPDLWFMDYRNADGSLAEMCGNGLRLFSRYLLNDQLVQSGEFTVATRAGLKQVRVARGGLIATNLGAVGLGKEPVVITHEGRTFTGRPADVGNPHAVVFTDRDVLRQLDLSRAPVWEPADVFPTGVNVEFVHEVMPGELLMRVYERGCGETLSCGTGVVASAAAYRDRSGFDGPIQVRVRGGDLVVTFEGDEVWLTGPAVIVARGEYWS